jgi:hypothetical protein
MPRMISGELPSQSELSSREQQRLAIANNVLSQAQIINLAILSLYRPQNQAFAFIKEANAVTREYTFQQLQVDVDRYREVAKEGFGVALREDYLQDVLEGLIAYLKIPIASRVEYDIRPENPDVEPDAMDFLFGDNTFEYRKVLNLAFNKATDRLITLLGVQIEDKDLYTKQEIDSLRMQAYVNHEGGHDYLFKTKIPGVFWCLRYDSGSTLPTCVLFIDQV